MIYDGSHDSEVWSNAAEQLTETDIVINISQYCYCIFKSNKGSRRLK